MRRANNTFVLLAAMLVIALACNVPLSQPPVQDPNAAFTAAAQTVAAHLTQAAQGQPSSTATPIPALPSASPAPTLAPTLPVPTFSPPTSVPLPTQQCDQAAFVTDVTVPDGSVVTKSQAFTKTWRLKNVGSCSWTPSYAVVFFSGESMGGPTVQALTGNVNPGQTVDISVNLTAPSKNGNYVGYWKLRNASGVTFTQFYVQVTVQGGVGVQVASLPALMAESGIVRSDGLVVPGDLRAGDNNNNHTLELFLSFDISNIPVGSFILEAVVNFSGASPHSGNPFSLGDGCFRGYPQNYGFLDAGDFFPGVPGGAIMRWCSWAEIGSAVNIPDVANAIQSAVGSPRFQIRLQFRPPTTNGNNIADQILLTNPIINITYDAP